MKPEEYPLSNARTIRRGKRAFPKRIEVKVRALKQESETLSNGHLRETVILGGVWQIGSLLLIELLVQFAEIDAKDCGKNDRHGQHSDVDTERGDVSRRSRVFQWSVL